MLPHDPLVEAARVSALAAIRRCPEPRSDIAKATALGARSIHPFEDEKIVFDVFQRTLETLLGRRLNQAEAFRFLMGCALRHQEEIFEEARRSSTSRPILEKAA